MNIPLILINLIGWILICTGGGHLFCPESRVLEAPVTAGVLVTAWAVSCLLLKHSRR